MSSTINNPNDPRGKAVFTVTTTTFVLASVFVFARLISRFAVLKSRTWDDWFIILAWFIAFGLSISIDFGTSKGLGRHDTDIPSDWIDPLRRSEYAFTILYNPALMATKTSILIFYLRMAKNTQSFLKIASYITLGVVNIAGVVLTFLNAFQCDPVSAAYDITKLNPKCISIVTLYLCSAPVNIVTDLAILVLPIPVLTGMRLPQRQKTILVFTFALGIFVTIVDVVRIYYLQQASTDGQTLKANTRLGTGNNFAWTASTAFMWSAVEVNVGIICACIPTLKPLVKKFMPAMIVDQSWPGTSTDKEVSSASQVPDDLNNQIPQRLASVGTVEHANPNPQHLAGDQEAQVSMMDFLTTPGGIGLDRGTRQNNPESEMNMLDFLTRPDSAPVQPAGRTTTAKTENTTYFGFVNMRRPKSMLKTRGRESFKYCTVVTILFFLWGFSYGLLNTLNNEIATIAHESLAQTLALTSAYFGAYFFGSLTVGQACLRKGGFKVTFITGLCIYGTGTIMFWPSAVLKSFPGFVISNFVVGFGLSILETAANPFLALCGRADKAEFRLLLAQAVQATASVLSQLLAEQALFVNIGHKTSLIDVQWAYLSITLFTVILSLFFYYMPLPEASDEDLQHQAEELGIDRSDTVFSNKLPLIYMTLGLGVLAQFCYVAAQESMATWFGGLLDQLAGVGGLTLTTENYVLVGHTTFAIGRFLFAGLTLIIPPRILLLVATIGCIVLASLTMSLSVTANEIAGPALVFFFFEGPIFPLIFAMSLRGLGRDTKLGAACITAAASGGAIFPFVMYAVQEVDRTSISYSYSVIIGIFAFGLLYPIYCNFVPKARAQLDPRQLQNGGLPEHGRTGSEARFGGPETDAHSNEGSIRRLSRRFSTMFEKIKAPNSGKERGSQELGIVEHRERSSWTSSKD